MTLKAAAAAAAAHIDQFGFNLPLKSRWQAENKDAVTLAWQGVDRRYYRDICCVFQPPDKTLRKQIY